MQRSRHSEAMIPTSLQFCKATIKTGQDLAVTFGREKGAGV